MTTAAYGEADGSVEPSNETAADKSTKDFDRLFALISAGTERTRGILYFFCLVLVVNIVFFFEDAFNTSSRRLQIMSAAVACVSAELNATKQPVPLGNIRENRQSRLLSTPYREPFLHGDIFKNHPFCDYYYDYVEKYYQIKMPPTNDLDRQALFEKYKAVLKDDTDFLSTTIPLLNIKIDRNDGLILQNTMALAIIFVLFFSISAERKSLFIVREIVGFDRMRIAAILNAHVFIRTASGSKLLSLAILLPVITQIYRLYQDLFEDGQIVLDLYGPKYGLAYLILEPATLFATSVVAAYCVLEVSELDAQLRTMQEAAKPPLPSEGRSMMYRRLDLLTVFFMVAILALAATPVLARVNP